MAVAFYIPDQEALLRKADQQEQQILKMRRLQWKLIIMMLLEVLKQYVQTEYKSLN